jgi:hypothetical protein
VDYTVLETDDEIDELDMTSAAVLGTGTVIYDIADNVLVAAGLVVPALNLTDQPKTIVIDGVRPEKPTSISAAPIGGSADLTNGSDYIAKYNTTNTGVNFTVQFADPADLDLTMNGGKIRIEGRVGDTNDWEVLGEEDISGPDFQSPYEIVVTILDPVLNTLGTGTPLALVHNTELNFRAYNIDRAENISIAASSEVTLNVDFDAPSLVQITSNQFDDHYKEGEVISLVAVFNDGDDVTDEQDYVFIVEDATLDLTLNVGTAALGYVTKTITAAEMATNLGTVEYTVGSGEGHYSLSKVKVTEIAISAANMLRDGSGNIVEGTEDLTDISVIGITNLDDDTDGKSIYADGWSPAAPTIASITTDVVPKVDLTDNQTDYWNSFNTEAIFMVNVVADESMGDGNITILARTGSRAYAVITDVSEGNPFSETVSTTQALGSDVSITITDEDLDAIIGWPTATTSTGDVDFKARSTDLAGNTTETGDADIVTIHVDEIVPKDKNSSNATPLTEMTTKVRDNPTHSVTVPGYWNIDTDHLEVDVGDLTGLDDNIVDGEVQLYGKISAYDWTTLGSERTISAGNLGDFSIKVSEYGDWETGLQTDAAPNGVKELHKGGLTWDNMDGNTIDIEVRITDAAGNYKEYSNDIAVFPLTNSRYITIDGTIEGHRPLIVEVTSDKANGWWGPESFYCPINCYISTISERKYCNII